MDPGTDNESVNSVSLDTDDESESDFDIDVTFPQCKKPAGSAAGQDSAADKAAAAAPTESSLASRFSFRRGSWRSGTDSNKR